MAKFLMRTHGILAAISKCPEFGVSAEEAKEIAAGYADVAKHYNWIPDEKAADWANLITTVAFIYGSKIGALKMRKEFEKQKQAPVINQPPRPQATPSQQSAPPQTPAHPVKHPIKTVAEVPAPLRMAPAEPDYADAQEG